MTLAAGVMPGRRWPALARPSLAALAAEAGEAAGLAIPDGDLVHYIDQVDTPNPVSVRDWTGTRIPLHAVSSGQVLLAFRPPTVVPALPRPAAGALHAADDLTGDALLERLRAIRRDGHAWVREEFDEGISSVAAPIADGYGEVVAAVHVHGPSYRFPAAGHERDSPSSWSPARHGSPRACGTPARARRRRPSAVDRPVLVDERLGVELGAAQHEPDRVDRLVPMVASRCGIGRVDRDRVARLQDVLLEADPDLEPAAQDVAPLVPGWRWNASGGLEAPPTS